MTIVLVVLAVLAAVLIIGGVFVLSLRTTERKSNAELARGKGDETFKESEIAFPLPGGHP